MLILLVRFSGCTSFFVARLPELPIQCCSNGQGNLGSLDNNEVIQPQYMCPFVASLNHNALFVFTVHTSSAPWTKRRAQPPTCNFIITSAGCCAPTTWSQSRASSDDTSAENSSQKKSAQGVAQTTWQRSLIGSHACGSILTSSWKRIVRRM